MADAQSRDIELLESVELRLALAASDEQLAQLVASFLVPLINKLNTSFALVKAKVLAILAHINTRVKSKTSTIKLPVNAIIDNLLHAAILPAHNASLITSLALVYLEMGLTGMQDAEKIAILPLLLNGLSDRPKQQLKLLVYLINSILPLLSTTPKPDVWLKLVDVTLNRPQDMVTLLHLELLFILYHIPDMPVFRASVQSTGITNDAMNVDERPSTTESFPVSPPCLSANDVTFVTCDGKFKPSFDTLRSLKMAIVHFVIHYLPDALPKVIGNDRLTEKLPVPVRLPKHLILLLTTCDRNGTLADLAETGLRKTGLKPNSEDSIFVQRLYALYQGDALNTKSNSSDPTYRQPASHFIKIKLLNIMSKSSTAANTFPQAIQVIFDALYGTETNNKLIFSGISFAQWIARMCAQEKLQPFAPVLLSGLLKCLTKSVASSTDMEVATIRGFVYEAIGLLLRKAPDLADIPILRVMFESITNESPNVRISIQDGLSTMLSLYVDNVGNRINVDELHALCEENIEKTEHQARYMALKYSNSTIPFQSELRCYYNLMLCSDTKLEIREEANKGLSLQASTNSNLPSIHRIVHLLFDKKRTPKSGKVIRNMTMETVQRALGFLRSIIVISADETVMARISAAETVDIDIDMANLTVRQNVNAWVVSASASSEHNQQQDLSAYLEFLELCLCSPESDDPLLQIVSARNLEELLMLAPPSLIGRVAHICPKLLVLLTSTAAKPEARKSIAHCIALIMLNVENDISTGTTDVLTRYLNAITSSTPVSTDELCGSLHILGYIVGRTAANKNSGPIEWVSKYRETVETSIITQLSHSSHVIVEAATSAIAEIGLYTTLHTPVIAFDKLSNIAKVNKNSRLTELALQAAGLISIGTRDLAPKVVLLMFELILLNKTVEVLFTAGEALANAGAGWDSKGLSMHYDFSGIQMKAESGWSETLQKTLDHCFEELQSGKPNARKPVCVYLVSLLKMCGSRPEIVQSLKRIHSALLALLSDKDELVQEVASTGMAFIYDLGDKSLKDDLVWSLVETLGEGQKKSLAQNVRPETTLFDNLGNSPEGTSLTTYQSILSLASEMNQPDLVYKFMQLASHNALWQSRVGGAFGVSALLSRANKELLPYLKGLIPKLYRYQFDPTPQVSQAMIRIWKALVVDSQKTIDECFDTIASDLLANLGNRQWRNREASCLALNDLLQRRTMSQLLSNGVLTELWHLTFRTLDDIKESVRTAALTTCKTFANLTVRYVDPVVVSATDGDKVLGIVVPFLLQKGLPSSAEDVRRFSLNTLVRLCEKGGSLMESYVAEIVPALLECLSSMEPQTMNYLSFHIEKYDMTQDQLEHARLSSIRSSPIMQALETMADNLTAPTMELLMANIMNIIRRGVGLPTRAGCARFVCSVCYKKPVLVKPYADELLKALSGAISDRSPAIRAAMSTAVGYAAKCASITYCVKFVTHCKKVYLENTDKELKSAVPVAFTEISRHAPDVAKNIESTFLPLTYFGCHDVDDSIRKIWQTCWETATSQSTAPIRLYTQEIIELSLAGLTSAKWEVKQQAALTITDVVKILDEKHMESYLKAVIDTLTEALTGRVWEGKEVVLNTLISCCVSYPDSFVDNRKMLNDIVEILARELKKKDVGYKRAVLDALCKLGEAVPERAQLDMYPLFKDSLITLVVDDSADDRQSSSAMDIDDERKARPLAHMLKARAFKTLACVWPTNSVETQVKYYVELLRILTKAIHSNVWIVQQEIVEGLAEILRKLSWSETVMKNTDMSVITDMVTLIVDTGEKMKYTTLRKSCIQCLNVVTQKIEQGDTQVKSKMANITRQMLDSMDVMLSQEKDDALIAELKELKRRLIQL